MLNFLTTMEIDAFKEGIGSNEISINRNEKTGKLFFSCGSQTGVVSSSFAENDYKDPVVSRVSSDETGEIFYMLHSRGSDAGIKCLCRL